MNPFAFNPKSSTGRGAPSSNPVILDRTQIPFLPFPFP